MKLSITMLAWLVSLSVVVSTLLTPVQLVIYAVLVVTIAYLARKRSVFLSPEAQSPWSFWISLLLLILLSVGYGHYWLTESLSSRLALQQDRSQVELDLIPEQLERQITGLRITARVVKAPAHVSNIQRVKLSWYSNKREEIEPAFLVGCPVRVEVVLRAPRRFANPLLFDYEAYNLLSDIDAIGYIREVIHPAEPLARQCEGYSNAETRTRLINERLNRLVAEASPWVAGLVFAKKNAFSSEKWQLAQATGTLHLLVVSGLHLGIISVFAVGIAALVRRLLVMLAPVNALASRWVTLLLIVSFTGMYAWLAGFGISLFRSWLMLVLFWFLWMSLRRFDWMAVLSLVMMAALLVNPLIFTQLGFQLSFIAVAALLTFFNGQIGSRLGSLVTPQLLVFLALMPLMLSWAMPVSFGQVVMNVVAIPYVGLVLLPLSLFNAVFDVDWFQQMLIIAGNGYWFLLEQYHGWSLLNVGLSAESGFQLLVVAVLLLLWMKALTFPINLLLPGFLVVALATGSSGPAQLRMLDVGQGLSVVINNGDKALVVDAGARYRGGFDLGEKVVAPYLRGSGAKRLQLVVTHSDNDHAGGVPALISQFDIDATYEGQAGQESALLDNHQSLTCRGDNFWRVMSPKVRYRFFEYELPEANDNNQSCVVMVSFAGTRILIPGDIEVAAEKALVDLYGNELRADILVAPHHGSRTSSSTVLLDAVAPDQVWISSGFNNRFKHPHPDVIERYHKAGISVVNTADHGSVALDENGVVSFTRQGWQRPWLYP